MQVFSFRSLRKNTIDGWSYLSSIKWHTALFCGPDDEDDDYGTTSDKIEFGENSRSRVLVNTDDTHHKYMREVPNALYGALYRNKKIG